MGDNQSKPDITDISNLTKEFSELNSPTKIHALLEMVKICNYQDQLDFQENLQNLFHKDFITLLPDQLTKRIIFYLKMDDAINCLTVSKSWNKIVGGCNSYWEIRAQEIGLSDPFIKSRLSDPSCKLPSLCIAALNHQEYIKGLVPRSFMIAKSPVCNGFSYMYAGNGVALRYEELNAHAQVTIECMNTPQSVVQVAMFDVTSFSGRIKWVSASDDYVLWKQVDGKWCGCDTKGVVTELDMWADEPVSQGFHSISFCSKCHLVAMMSEAEDDCEVWDLQVIKLFKGKSSGESSPLRKMVYPIPLERVQNSWEKKRHFLGGEVILLPASLETDSTGFCKTHTVLLQIDSNLAIHKLQAVDEAGKSVIVHQLLPDTRLSKPLKIFSPKPSDQPLSLMDFSGARGRPSFCISADLQRVAMMYESYLYVWNLRNYEEESCVDLIDQNLPGDSKVIAIGSVYAVLASNAWGVCAVVLVRTGEIMLQGSLADSAFNADRQSANRFNFCAPLCQKWLERFAYFDFWPLGLVIDSCIGKQSSGEKREEQELQAVVGVRSRQRPTLQPLTLAVNGLQF